MAALPRVGVAGTGMMGPGIAAIFAMSGRQVTLVSRTADGASKGRETARSLMQWLVERELVEADVASTASGLIEVSDNPESVVKEVDLFVESIPEDMALKQEYFARLDGANEKAILCSNTSGMSITQIASRCRRPERVFTTHFWNPPHLMPLVEVVMGDKSELSLGQELVSVLEECGKAPVLVRKDRPGQLCNRIQQAMVRECMYIVQEGIATAEDVDRAIKTGAGLRTPVYGVFEHADLVGLPLVQTVQNTVLPDLCDSKEAVDIHKRRVAEGQTGAAAGKGMLEWPAGKAEQVKARRDAFLVEFLKMQKEGRFD